MTGSGSQSGKGERRASKMVADHVASPAHGQEAAGSYADLLTGCHNRRYLFEVLEPQLAVARDYDFPVSLVLLQLTNYSQARFALGEKLASAMLQEVASALRGCVRTSDLVVRYNDDTFGVLLLHSDENGALTVARRLKAALARLTGTKESPYPVIASISAVAEYIPGEDARTAKLVSRLERALREAAARGDGTVVRAGELLVV